MTLSLPKLGLDRVDGPLSFGAPRALEGIINLFLLWPLLINYYSTNDVAVFNLSLAFLAFAGSIFGTGVAFVTPRILINFSGTDYAQRYVSSSINIVILIKLILCILVILKIDFFAVFFEIKKTILLCYLSILFSQTARPVLQNMLVLLNEKYIFFKIYSLKSLCSVLLIVLAIPNLEFSYFLILFAIIEFIFFVFEMTLVRKIGYLSFEKVDLSFTWEQYKKFALAGVTAGIIETGFLYAVRQLVQVFLGSSYVLFMIVPLQIFNAATLVHKAILQATSKKMINHLKTNPSISFEIFSINPKIVSNVITLFVIITLILMGNKLPLLFYNHTEQFNWYWLVCMIGIVTLPLRLFYHQILTFKGKINQILIMRVAIYVPLSLVLAIFCFLENWVGFCLTFSAVYIFEALVFGFFVKDKFYLQFFGSVIFAFFSFFTLFWLKAI